MLFRSIARGISRKTLYHALSSGESIREMVLPTEIPLLWVLPAEKNLAGAEIELVDAEDRNYALKNLLARVKDYFHYIIIDCPPSLGILTINGLTAADSLLVPIQCEYYALEGVTEGRPSRHTALASGTWPPDNPAAADR